MEDIKSC